MPSPPHPRLRNRHSLPPALSNGAHPSDYAARELWTAIPCDSLEYRRVVPTVAVGTTIADRPPRRSVRARLRIRLLLWMNGGETCCLPHTVQFLGHALPALCRTHVGWNDVLLSPCPSLPSLRRRLLPFVVRLVHGYYGTVRLLLYVHVRRAAYGLRGPVLITRPRRAGDLPVLVHVVSQRARVLRLRRTEQSTRDNVVAVLPSSTRNGVGVLFHRLFEAQ